ncbi:helix-turn-helix domain-containing protein [Chitinophaga eiseniae]|uniref:Helix-turn-helix domain-containing protein n=1 Tax=Chitinophaga eiseniae TaxID=634771 RepID=A0A847SK32_9BACT|nr:helix-turn-helix domain-containing protein [Chitinophaga eiseniae]NLR77489.1 helix-turn-helix domain-containing protein [Chitinophaga eiseniae]
MLHMKTDGLPTLIINDNHFFWTGNAAAFHALYPLALEPQRLGCYLLLCADPAGGLVTIDNSQVHLDQSGIICIKPNSVASIHVHSGSVICFTEDFFSLRYNSNVLYQFSFLAKEPGSFIPLDRLTLAKWQQLTGLMQQEFHSRYKGADRVLRSYLNILLCMLDQCCSTEAPAEKNNSRDEKIRVFEQLLEAHYKVHKTPSFYASQLHITTNYLNKLCQQCKHTSSGELIRKRVTIEAQRLLYHTGLSVAEIADTLGFESASYFATFFKKNTGIPPERFRKRE